VAAVAVEAEEFPTLPAVRRKRVEVTPLLVDDAVEMMQTGGEDLVVFTNVANGGLSILYRRQDGSFVLVEPDLH
jgi:hypothetical protein